jgi:hypothetical protein
MMSSHPTTPTSSVLSSEAQSADNFPNIQSITKENTTNDSSPQDRLQIVRSNFPVFRNQVAGHYPLLSDYGTICKPLIPNEYDFYSIIETDLPELLPFTAKYYGVMDLERLTEQISSVTSVNSEERKQFKQGIEEKVHDSNKIESVGQPLLNLHSNTDILAAHAKLYNKWAAKCANSRPISRSQIQYLVLEDLSFGYEKPCILDIKIGTRQHSDTESPAKIARKTARCLNSTSNSLGLRICGMQVYHPDQGQYTFRDKYWGRALTPITFKQALRDYFFDGKKILLDKIIAMMQRLELFQRAVSTDGSNRWRFYSASLLLLYEGEKITSPSASNNNTSRNSGNNSPRNISPLKTERSRSHSPANLPENSESNCIHSIPSGNVAQNSNSTVVPTKVYGRRDSTPMIDVKIPSNNVQNNNSTPVSAHSGGLTPSSSSPALSLQRRPSVPAIITLQTLTEQDECGCSCSNNAEIAAKSKQNSHSTPQNCNSKSGDEVATPADAHKSKITNNIAAEARSMVPMKIYREKRKTTQRQAREKAKAKGYIDCRMIDFAHTSKTNEQSVDEGLQVGFHSLISMLKELIYEEKLQLDSENQDKQGKAEDISSASGSEQSASSDSNINSNNVISNGTAQSAQSASNPSKLQRDIPVNNSSNNPSNSARSILAQ